MLHFLFIPGAKLDRLSGFLDDPRLGLELIGHELNWESRSAFQLQAWEGIPWMERPCPNVMGALADLVDGRDEPKLHRLQRGPALVDTGNLMNSIAFNRIGRYEIVQGSNLPYAKPHDEGDGSEIGPVTKSVQQRLWAWMRRIGTKKSVCGKTVREAFGWLLNKRYEGEMIMVDHPQRQFVGMSHHRGGARDRIDKGLKQLIRDI